MTRTLITEYSRVFFAEQDSGGKGSRKNNCCTEKAFLLLFFRYGKYFTLPSVLDKTAIYVVQTDLRQNRGSKQYPHHTWLTRPVSQTGYVLARILHRALPWLWYYMTHLPWKWGGGGGTLPHRGNVINITSQVSALGDLN